MSGKPYIDKVEHRNRTPRGFFSTTHIIAAIAIIAGLAIIFLLI